MALYPRIPHLTGSARTSDDLGAARALATRLLEAGDAGRPGARVIVSEKLDGTCVALERRGHDVLALGREGRPCAASRNPGRRAFAAFVAAQPERWRALAAGDRLVCEWMAMAHGVRYALPHEPLVVIDLLRASRRAPHREAVAAADTLGLPSAHLLHAGGPYALGSALEALGECGHHGAERAEGVVYRLERMADDAVLALAKYVRPGFIAGRYLPEHQQGQVTWNQWRGAWELPAELAAGARALDQAT